MLSTGTYVIHDKYGICFVKEIQKNMKVGAKRNDYFVLKPVFSPSSSVYVPVASTASEQKIKALPTAEEINAMLDGEQEIPWVYDYKARNDLFDGILADGDRKKILGMIKCLLIKKEELAKDNKKLRISDENVLKNAEKIISEEFSFILGIPKENVGDYIINFNKPSEQK